MTMNKQDLLHGMLEQITIPKEQLYQKKQLK